MVESQVAHFLESIYSALIVERNRLYLEVQAPLTEPLDVPGQQLKHLPTISSQMLDNEGSSEKSDSAQWDAESDEEDDDVERVLGSCSEEASHHSDRDEVNEVVTAD